jgi:hypothetical protein
MPSPQGIHIGDKFFPMKGQKEDRKHEIYLHTVTPAKPNAPMKLYAEVTGKFTVNDKDMERLSGKLRDAREKEEKARSSRQTIMLDEPPKIKKATATSSSSSKKSTGATSMFRKPVPHSQLTQASVASTSGANAAVVRRVPSTATSRAQSPLQPPASSSSGSSSTTTTPPTVDIDPALRSRLIQLLAVRQALSTDDVVKEIHGPDAEDSKKQSTVQALGVVSHVHAT